MAINIYIMANNETCPHGKPLHLVQEFSSSVYIYSNILNESYGYTFIRVLTGMTVLRKPPDPTRSVQTQTHWDILGADVYRVTMQLYWSAKWSLFSLYTYLNLIFIDIDKTLMLHNNEMCHPI